MFNNELSYLLREAVRKGDLKTIKYLIEQGADYKIKDNNLNTILSVAAKNGHIKIIDYLNSLEQK
ncbi:MAG TPA: ankyrin repeat domain-containing protein [Rickettsia endosymbiont of Omalisus fontisbellaquei]|nr:ankyrin repeat domain-containing protein [Rickettsia endosymbiont of Omalisus fontisbellaquei]